MNYWATFVVLFIVVAAIGLVIDVCRLTALIGRNRRNMAMLDEAQRHMNQDDAARQLFNHEAFEFHMKEASSLIDKATKGDA